MKIQVLMSPGCGYGERALKVVEEVERARAPGEVVEVITVATLEDATALSFPGSPTIRNAAATSIPGRANERRVGLTGVRSRGCAPANAHRAAIEAALAP